MVECIEGFGHALKLHPLSEREGAAKARINAEKVKACPGVAADHGTLQRLGAGIQPSVLCECVAGRTWPLRCGLLGIGSSGDVEWQARVILQNTGQSPAMRKVAGEAMRLGYRRVDQRIERHAIPLIVIGATAVDGEVEIIDWRAEKTSPTLSIA